MGTIIANTDKALPLAHQMGKLVFGTIVGFAASKLAEKGYDAAYACYQTRKIVTK